MGVHQDLVNAGVDPDEEMEQAKDFTPEQKRRFDEMLDEEDMRSGEKGLLYPRIPKPKIVKSVEPTGPRKVQRSIRDGKCPNPREEYWDWSIRQREVGGKAESGVGPVVVIGGR